VQPLWKSVWRFLKKLKTDLPNDPAEHIQRDVNQQMRDTCIPIFIAALCTTAKLWNQSRYPTTNEWIKTIWYLYAMEYYSDIKKNKIMPFPAKLMELEMIILR
jgi:hypothetical protein